jgi:hypothetical protein
VAKLVTALLAAVAVVELVAVLAVAAVLFMLGATTSIALGAGMLLVAAVAGVVALRAMRPRGTRRRT